jgi:alkaline phosphatase D
VRTGWRIASAGAIGYESWMASRFDRRSFLQGLVVTISAGAAACGDDETTPEEVFSTDPADQDRVYAHGIASGDPRADAVILWTRVEPEAEAGPFEVIVEVSKTEDFADLVANETVTVDGNYDFTLRVKVTGLEAFTSYFYRFKSRGVQSPNGRTKTAPSDDQDVSVRFAFASCQDYIGRYYHAWKALANEPSVDFVLFLGDYIYETNGDPDFQQVAPDRAIDIPEGIQLLPEDNAAVKAASTLSDYRGIYKQYRRDADLKKVHALYPFICIWDDHEFANDCWQDHSTDFNEEQGDEKNPSRRHAASQAWFEFQPADVTFEAGASPPNDIKIYRSLRYGRHVELFMTDQRSYRSDHVIPEGGASDARPPGAPMTIPTYGEVGKVFPNSEVFSRNFVKKPAFDIIEDFVRPTMLGTEQKQWLTGAITGSTATWKVWANETQLAQMMLDLTSFDIPESFKGIYYFTADQWDGYRTERKEVIQALSNTTNVVALTGDIHAFYACEIHVDPDNITGRAALVEFVTAGISSSPAQEITQGVVDSNPAFSTLASLVPQFDTILTSTSPEYKYANSLSHGLAIVDVNGASDFTVTFLQIADVKNATFDGNVGRKTFRASNGSTQIESL